MGVNFSINTEELKKQIQALSDVTKAIRTCESELMRIKENLNSGSFAELQITIESLKNSAEKKAVASTQLADVLRQAIAYYEKAEQTIMSQSVGSGDVDGTDSGDSILDKIHEVIDRLLEMLKGKEQDTCEFGGDPINFTTGNFVFDRTYLMSKGLFPLKFQLNYNSLHIGMESKNSVVGKNWSFQYGVCVEQLSDGMKIVWEDGHADYFKQVDGVYLPEYDMTKKITMHDDEIEYENVQGKHYFFAKDTGLNTRISDANGNSLYLEYGENGRLLSVANDSEEGLVFEYNREGYICRVTDHASRCVQLLYDGEYLQSVIDEMGNPFVFVYDEDGFLSATINARNICSLRNLYDASGRVIEQIYPDETSMLLEYNDQEGTVKVTEQNKNVVTYRHDDRMRNIETIYEDGSISYKYNDHNQKISVIDKMGFEKKYEYDHNGNLTRIINPLDETLDITYNSRSQVTSMALCGKVICEKSYDSRGNIIEKKDAIGRVMRVMNNEQGKPVCVVAPDGSKLLLSYDSRGNVASITDALGGKTAYEYDKLNRVTSTTDAMGNRTEYEYDMKGHLIRVKKPDGYDKTYTYNSGSLVTEIRDFNGAVTQKKYNDFNNLEKIILPDNGEIKYEYNEMQQITKRIDPNGAVNTYEYNKLHHMVKATNAYGGTMQYEYDANGNRTKITSSDTGCVEYTYDALNRITSVKDADGCVSYIAYNHFGQKTKMTDARGNIREVVYNDAGQKVKSIDVLGNETNFAYNEMGLLKEKVDPAGRCTRFEYLPGGFLNKIINSNGTEVQFEYNLNGKITKKTTSEGYELNFEYDCLNRIVRTSSNQGQENRYEYDTMGNCVRSIDGNGNVTAYEYNIMNKLIAVVDADGNRTEYNYDCMGNVQDIYHCMPLQIKEIAEQNEGNQKILFMHYERDFYGQVTEETDAIGNKITYEYDEHGRMIRKTDADGMSTAYSYTLGGLLSEIQYEDGDSVYLSYNELKQLVEIKDWLGITTLTLNDAGQPTKVTDSMGNEVAYERGVLGERKSLQYPDGKKIFYEYDDMHRMRALQTEEGIINYEYDSLGRITEKIYPNGTKSVIDYLKSGRVGNYIHYDAEGVLDSAKYEYDAVGNTIGINRFRRDIPEQSGNYQYEYDRMNRLVEVQKDEEVLRQYGYDAYGNRTSRVEDGIRTDYFYDDANQLLREIAPDILREYKYDKRGNMQSVFTNGILEAGYEYDAKNRIKAEYTGVSASMFEYDGMGHRVMEHDYVSESISLVDGKVDFGNDLKPTNDITYVLDHAKRFNNVLMEKDATSTKRYLWDGNMLGMKKDNQIFYCMHDLNGSPMRLMNEEADIMENYSFDEFGRDLQESEHMQPFGYAGFYRDKITATYFVQLRNYEPAIGRFSSKDIVRGHIAAPYMSNSYSYCFNRPIDMVDLSGAWPQWIEDAGDWVCDRLDDIGDGIDYVVDAAGDVIQDITTTVFEGADYLWDNYVPQGVKDFTSAAGSWLLERGRDLMELDFPFTNTDMSDIWCWFTTQTEIGSHFMGAGDFFATEDGVYHTNPDCWQQMMGYNDFYDYVFDGFTDMRVNKDLSFTTADGTQYTIWMWKGDYFNLGSGGETGIYYGKPGDSHLNCATDSNLHMSLTLLDGDGNEIFTYAPEDYQWWITGFDPSHQDVDAGDLTVIGSIDFSDNPELWEAFLAKYGVEGRLDQSKYCIDKENMTLNYRW